MTFRGVGVLLLEVSDKMEIMDFLQPRIKQSCKNIIITLEKCVIGIDYVHHYLPLVRKILGACFGLGPFTLDTAIDTTIRGSFRNLTFIEEGGRCLGETSQRRFSGQNR